MDVQRAIEFLLQQQAQFAAQSDARMTRVEEMVERVARNQERADGEIREIRNEMRRAVRLSVQEARAERKRRKEADEQLAAGQESLRQSLQAFIDSMQRPRNGHDTN